jgi:peptide/nickel transport system substrate-binding protein
MGTTLPRALDGQLRSESESERFVKKRARLPKQLAGSCLAATILAALFTSSANSSIGSRGGRLVISQRAEPKTLNPLVALDTSSREIIGLITADLIHINRFSQNTEASLASSWQASPDGRQYTLQLRRGLKFSDGQPFDADDVLFTFEVYLDERVHATQRDLLIISGRPIHVEKLDGYTVRFDLYQPYAAAERLFDSIPILPRHLWQQAYAKGLLAQAWNLTTPPGQIAGLGPFRIKEYLPGQHLALERNPYYWKKDSAGNRLPYLDEIVSVFTGNAEVETMRFQLGEVDVVGRLSADNFSLLEKHERAARFRLDDLGPGFEYNFLFFNLNEFLSENLASTAAKEIWFRRLPFRKAVSVAIDREAIKRLAYHGRAYPLSTFVTPGNRLWVNRSIVLRHPHSITEARRLLRTAGFSWDSTGRLLDDRRQPVTFSLVFNSGNPQHTHAATLIQKDLEQIGMDVQVVPLESRALLSRIFKTYDYDAAIIEFASGDADPNSEINVWTSGGGAHVWNLGTKRALMPWEEEVDRLMQQQMTTLKYESRKVMYDRVQQLVWENLPVICLVSPNVLVGATDRLGNFRPALLGNHTLWNAEELFLRP